MAVLVSLAASPVAAHDGVDHGADSGDAAIHQLAEPRFSASSDTSEVVGIVGSGGVLIYVDNPVTNAMIENLQVDVEVGGDHYPAISVEPGVYRIDKDWVRAGTRQDLVITLMGAGMSDLLVAQLTTSAPQTSANIAHGLPSRSVLVYVLGACFALYLIWLLRTAIAPRRAIRTLFDIAIVTVVGLVGLAFAKQMDAGPESTQRGSETSSIAVVPAAALKRLPDGTVFVPKPAQRLLELRTAVLQPQSVNRAHTLFGQVIADPSHSALVQAGLRGTLLPPDAGFPRLGQRVKKDEILGYLQPTLTASENAALQQQLADIDRDLYLTDKQIKRIKQQTSGKSVDVNNSVLLDIRYAEKRAFEQRKRAVTDADHRLPLRAPVAGVVSQAGIASGMAVEPAQTLFHIIDPDALWIQAVCYKPSVLESITAASAMGDDNRSHSAALQLIGHSSTANGLGQTAQFQVTSSERPFVIGELVTIWLQGTERIQGLPVPESSVKIDGNGNAVIWVKIATERYAPMPVTTVSVDSQHDLVTGDLPTDSHVVVKGADLLSALL